MRRTSPVVEVPSELQVARSALGRFLPFVTVSEFSAPATCYAWSNGRDRPGANVQISGTPEPLVRDTSRNRLNMKLPQKTPVLATAYLIVVLLTASWALYVDTTLLNSQREHLLPDVVLAVVTLPSSYFLGVLFSMWPDLFSLPFSQVGAMILCGLAQAWLLFVLTHRLVRPVNPR
jgi:hypothetical protein